MVQLKVFEMEHQMVHKMGLVMVVMKERLTGIVMEHL